MTVCMDMYATGPEFVAVYTQMSAEFFAFQYIHDCMYGYVCNRARVCSCLYTNVS